MALSSTTLHESADKLRSETIDRHRAVVSLMEELEAMDWYDQRVDAAEDEALRSILIHNRDEEKEHAVMLLEWIRRRDPELDAALRQFLFTQGSITEKEENEDKKSAAPERNENSSLIIGSLRGGKR